jgi:hypothetical protein
MGQRIVAALAQGVPEQQAALAEVGEIFLPVSGRGLFELTPLQRREFFSWRRRKASRTLRVLRCCR